MSSSKGIDYSKFEALDDAELELEEARAKEIDFKARKDELERARDANKPRGGDDEDDDEDSDMEDSPLFWTKPPSARKNPSKKALALEEMFNNMVYEDRDPAHLAEDFKERGNVSFRHGQLKDALHLYEEALSWAYKSWTDNHDASEVIGAILSNRAAINLKLGNFRSTIQDAFASLKVAPHGSSANKAKFRGATACLALNKPSEAQIKFLERNDPPAPPATTSKEKTMIVKRDEDDMITNEEGQLVPMTAEQLEKRKQKRLEEEREKAKQLELELKNIEGLREKAKKMIREQMEKEKQAYALFVEQRRADAAWRATLAKHDVQVGPLTMDLQPFTGGKEQKGSPGPRPDTTDPENWAWPCLLMYPEHSQSDFVQAFHESSTFLDLLSMIFPPNAPAPDWDTTGSYVVDQLEVYFRERMVKAYDLTRPLSAQTSGLLEAEDDDFRTRKWYRVPLETALHRVIRRNPHYVVPGIATFVIVSRSKKSGYREVFLTSCKQRDGSVVEFQNV